MLKKQIIEDYLNAKKISKTKFCKMCKISLSTFNKIMSNDDNFGIIALFKIARVMNIRVCVLFD